MSKRALVLISILSIVAVAAGCRRLLHSEALKTEIPTVEGAFYVGTDSCIPCHDDVYQQFKKTVHYRLNSTELKGAQRGCESCHGPGSKHLQTKGDVADIISFAKLPPEQGSKMCLECHRGSPTMDWRANVHVNNGVGCNDCHKSHKVTAPKMVYLGEPDLCFTCHQDKKAQTMLPSRHPLREKKIKCSSCHDNHGSENHNLKKQHINEVCYDCHAEYQGPFVFEHAPAVEDCTICHDPHGTVANNLLRQSEPYLCLRCHRGHKQNPKTGPHPTAAALMTSCSQCHSAVHGTDLPSQVYGGGLTR